MKQSLFESRHQQQWQTFAEQLKQLEQGKAKAADVADFPHQYRRLCQHLALAQERGYSSYLIDPLQQLALRGHSQLYRHRSQLAAEVLAFLLADFPRLVREQWRFVLIAGLLFFGSLLGIALLVYLFPDLIYSIVSPQQVPRCKACTTPRPAAWGAPPNVPPVKTG